MANEIPVTLVGYLARDPELRFLPSGKAVASLSMGVSNRVKEGETWVDGETTWFSVSVWEGFAENVVESLHKGDRVIVQGGMFTRAYTTKEGEKRTSLEVRAEAIGPDLRYATATVAKVGSTRPAATPAADPWAVAAPTGDLPPF
jgi:single-strand DNA-binding protein